MNRPIRPGLDLFLLPFVAVSNEFRIKDEVLVWCVRAIEMNRNKCTNYAQ